MMMNDDDEGFIMHSGKLSGYLRSRGPIATGIESVSIEIEYMGVFFGHFRYSVSCFL